MFFLELTLPTPEANLSADETLLEACGAGGPEVLRVWEPSAPFVVVGYSNRTFEGVRLEACAERGIPVLRRHSGGGTVVLGPGCLAYAVVLRKDPARSSVRTTNQWIMDRQRQAMEQVLGAGVRVRGFTDLALDGRKFSGNAQYRGRDGILFHGTFMFGMDIGLIEAVLELPSVAPDYREGRSHTDFLMNLDVPAARVKAALRSVWGAVETLDSSSLRLHLQ